MNGYRLFSFGSSALFLACYLVSCEMMHIPCLILVCTGSVPGNKPAKAYS
jgi:hypothetical protein